MPSIKRFLSKSLGMLLMPIDLLAKHQVKPPRLCGHSTYLPYLVDNFNKPGKHILKIGSREFSDTAETFHSTFYNAECTGIDIIAGNGVDIVCDCHKLEEFFQANTFDLVYFLAVLEHLYAPWLMPSQISRILKLGGMTFHETHFSFGSHERPWHFFQFSDMGLKSLFNSDFGFEVVDAGMSNPIIGRFTFKSSRYLRHRIIDEMYCHSCILAKKISESSFSSWDSVDTNALVSNTFYPPPKKMNSQFANNSDQCI